MGGVLDYHYLDVLVTLDEERNIETEMYYKDTNNHHYLEYNSFHPEHVKNNIPYNLAKRIIVFTSKDDKVILELEKLKRWLKQSKYPDKIINESIKNAKLQGPANNPSLKKKVIPLTSYNADNYSNKNVIKQTKLLIENCPDETTKKVFEDKEFVLALKQPKSIRNLFQLTSS